MCKWRQVRHNYTVCGHVWDIPQEEILCQSTRCKFSPQHPQNCGPNCRQTCWQYHQFPEQHTRTIAGRCPRCTQGS
ncbi:hypothetical protein B0H19DRAFT_1166169 [Mycena capillaripes]|nr:hypothetical protein B0H19DRAFT_1166169 [Mycena capillaripes]